MAPRLEWTQESWTQRPNAQSVHYDSPSELSDAVKQLRDLPPLVTSGEIEKLKKLLADAQAGKRFLLQGGDCAETFAECRPSIIANKLKILLQMSLVLAHAFQGPVIRVGRLAGQYGKPRSSPTESRNGVTLPSYFGDNVNGPEFTEAARRPDPQRLVRAHQHAALTLNFMRSLGGDGFADVHHPENWELGFFRRAPLTPEIRAEYEQTTKKLNEALKFMSVLGEQSIAELTRVDFYTSHEGLNLWYESAHTVSVPRRTGFYDLSTHMPWIGERTRALDGAHIEFFRGVRNPVAVKLGPKTDPHEIVKLLEVLNPTDEPGKAILVTRLGANNVASILPSFVDAVRTAGRHALWITDPMHGNTQLTSSGRKTRHFDDVLREVEQSFDVHEACGSLLGGIHFELTGEDVTECTGGAAAITEHDLEQGNYSTACDPRLNYRQALEMSFIVARRMTRRRRLTDMPPSR